VLKPTPGELLAAVSAGLRHSVLVALPPGEAQRQLKAALHVLDRLQRCWDLLPPYLESDNADLRVTLQEVLTLLTRHRSDPLPPPIASIAEKLAQLSADNVTATPRQGAAVRGLNALSLTSAAATNDELQSMVVTLARWFGEPGQLADSVLAAQRSVLNGLYRRMIERELEASGTSRERD
jgi:hypothetical protein